jgi:RimJ/RimL family protein N-acetyltransferase
MIAPDQMHWEYDESWAKEPTTPQEEIAAFRDRRRKHRDQNHSIFAMADGKVIGFVGINRYMDSARHHSGDLGYGVLAAFARQGIGTRLLRAAVQKARELGLKRLEANCFADNAASIALLKKCGFGDEGIRVGAIMKDGILRDQRCFGLLL